MASLTENNFTSTNEINQFVNTNLAMPATVNSSKHNVSQRAPSHDRSHDSK